MDTTTEPMPLEHRQKRQLFRFDSTVSMGTLLQMGLITTACVLAYGKYTADEAKRTMEVEQIKLDATVQRSAMKESLTELRSDVKDIQKTLNAVDRSMVEMKAQQQPRRP